HPSMPIQGAIQAIRVARPISPDRTLLESWTFRLAGAPDSLLQRTLLYTRLINATTSIVANGWVTLHRNHPAAEADGLAGDYNGLSEVSMRGQYRAWARFMTLDMP